MYVNINVCLRGQRQQLEQQQAHTPGHTNQQTSCVRLKIWN
jgi:hypothetical protein